MDLEFSLQFVAYLQSSLLLCFINMDACSFYLYTEALLVKTLKICDFAVELWFRRWRQNYMPTCQQCHIREHVSCQWFVSPPALFLLLSLLLFPSLPLSHFFLPASIVSFWRLSYYVSLFCLSGYHWWFFIWLFVHFIRYQWRKFL